MKFSARIAYSGKVTAANNAQAGRYAREDVFEQAGHRTYEVLKVEECDEDEDVTNVYRFDKDRVDVVALRSKGLAGNHEDRDYGFRIEFDVVVEADSLEEAREKAALGPLDTSAPRP